MLPSRRTVLAAAVAGLVAGCGPKKSSKVRKKPTQQPPPVASIAARGDIVARYRGVTPSQWGVSVSGVTTKLPTSDKLVALTFDACGGRNGTGYNEALMAVLRKHRASATLFLNQRWIVANLPIVEQLASDPLFEIANHGTQHRPLSVTGRSAYGIAGTRDVGEVYDEVVTNHLRLTELMGKPPRFFRAGTAHCDDVAVRIAADLGERIVNFDVNGDAGATFTAVQVEHAIAGALPGSIVIGHMNRPSSGTAQGVDAALNRLTAAGFRFVQLSAYLR